ILGTALKFYNLVNSISLSGSISLGPHYEEAQIGWTAVQGLLPSGLPFDIRPYLHDDPLDLHCGQQSGGGGTLVNNPTFTAPNAEWASSGADPPTNPAGQANGLLLIGGVRQSLALDPSHSYAITVMSNLLAPKSADTQFAFTVQLGAGT